MIKNRVTQIEKRLLPKKQNTTDGKLFLRDENNKVFEKEFAEHVKKFPNCTGFVFLPKLNTVR